jgi:ERCC4-type nuclease
MGITVDTNAGENGLYESLKAELGEDAVQRQRLNVGDVQITTETGEAVIVERKTWHDLASSLRDGRYHNQKAAMVGAAEAGATVLYVVEGGVRGWHGVTKCGDLIVPNSQLEAAIAKTAVRDNVPVLRTANVQHTKDLVVYLAKQLVAGELQHKPVVAEPVKKRHTRDLDGATLFTHLISNVPGMSAAKATAVSKSFGCFADLAAASEADLANVMVEPSDASGKKKARRLGPAAAARLKSL